ncbi:DUF58 domain-containing protein [Neorhodopirellula pilleata]|uniref:DUF58 domain-containing protein n=1 Tax=Neorhodopirellula pilleata TaxID=2714738 RepID=A0A5C6AQ46_9BACT|nr:DUF58 domain-containing protein [Neorhodopirellula pilleata]TWU01840.1 hypothetical protein Pla100_15760 [Neorhodopirellula pilleata]
MNDPNASSSTTTSSSSTFTIVAICAGVLVLGMIAGAGLWMTAAMTVALVVAGGAYLSSEWSENVVAVRQDGLPSIDEAPTNDDPESGDLAVRIGSKIPITVAVTNRGKLPVAWVLAEDLLPRLTATENEESDSASELYRAAPLTIDGPRLQVLSLWPGQTKYLRYTIHCRRRGYYQIGPTVLETGDPVGMYRRFRLGTRPVFVTVLPKIELLSTFEIGSRRPIGEIRIRANIMPDPTRLRGIRQWQIGDPMRSVHWAATARTGTLHSKIYEPSSVIGSTLILDMHVDTNPDRHEPFRTDLAITAAASIAAALHDAGEPFGLATNGRDAADRVREEGFRGDHRVSDPFRQRSSAGEAAKMSVTNDRLRPVIISVERGPVHLQAMIRTLARLERTDGLTLAEFLIESESRLSNETTLLVILQQAPPETIGALVGLARRGWAVSVIMNSLDLNEYTSVAGPLMAENIQVSHLSDERSILDVCRQQMMRS